MRPSPWTVAIVLLAALLAALPAPAGAQDLRADIDGPMALAPQQTAAFNVTLSGGPLADVAYSLEYYLEGPDLAGGSPTLQTPGRASGNGTRFTINVTAPTREQEVSLVVKVTARVGDFTENATADIPIEVIVPVVLSATFRNAAPTAALNVTVRFYVDGRFVGSQRIPRIDATGEATASLTWVPEGLEPGAHQVRIEADLDGNGIIDPARGEVVTSEVFIREAPSLSAGWTLILGIVVFVLAFLTVAALRRRGRT